MKCVLFVKRSRFALAVLGALLAAALPAAEPQHKSRPARRHVVPAFACGDNAENDFDIEVTAPLSERGHPGQEFHGSYMVVTKTGAVSTSVSGTTPESYSVYGALVSASFQKESSEIG